MSTQLPTFQKRSHWSESRLVDFSVACFILLEHSDRATYVSGTSRSLAGNPVGENCRSRCFDQRVERHWECENTGQSCEEDELT
jgi:hypothetical protein